MNHRVKIEALYQKYDQLIDNKHGHWTKDFLTKQKGWSINSYRTQHKGPAIWILSGIHGDEPAGPIALSMSIDILAKYGKTHPMVILPMCNPFGYVHEMRYPDGGNSVGDNQWLLRYGMERPVLPEAQVLSYYILEQCKHYPPVLVLDLHEDALSQQSYIYSHTLDNALAQTVLTVLTEAGLPPKLQGSTRFGEKIRNGIINSSNDGSIDELFATSYIIKANEKYIGPNAKTVLVIETPCSVPLLDRVTAHLAVIDTVLDCLI